MTRSRILLVDPNKNVQKAIKAFLEANLSTTVTCVGRQDNALIELRDGVFDLVIANSSLSNLPSDQSGIEFLYKLPSNQLKLLITHNREQALTLPYMQRFTRSELDPKKFLNKVKETLKTFKLLPASAVKELAKHARENDLTNLGNKRFKHTLHSILRLLFPHARKVELKMLTLGRGGSSVVLATPISPNRGTQYIVKLGSQEMLYKESHNYHQYVEPYAALRSTTLSGVAYHHDYVALKFLFIGSDRQVKDDFLKFYHTPDQGNQNLIRVIENIFITTCKLWYESKTDSFSGGLIGRSLIKCYLDSLNLESDQRLGFLSEEIATTIESLCQKTMFRRTKIAIQPGGSLLFHYGRGRIVTLPHPVTFFRALRYTLPDASYFCITHGDLHEDNIFVDNDQATWLIDFGRTDESHALRDVVQFESVIKFTLLRSRSIIHRIWFEDVLLGQTCLDSTIDLPESIANDPIFVRAKDGIETIRLQAAKILEDPSDIDEYFAGLYFNALKTLTLKQKRYEDEVGMRVRQTHALYSAAKLSAYFSQVEGSNYHEPE
ncbi:MAG: phosphotransferase [Candidatus Promineifilaceae bacterium]